MQQKHGDEVAALEEKIEKNVREKAEKREKEKKERLSLTRRISWRKSEESKS